MARQLYDYWFVQFDFPDEKGKPFKSSGGKIVWNEKLKRKIPVNWRVSSLGDLCSFRNGINYSKEESGTTYDIINVRNISATSLLLDGEKFDRVEIKDPDRASCYLVHDNDIIIARSGCPGKTRLFLNPQNTLFCGFIICCTGKNSAYKNHITYFLKGLEGTNATKSGGSILQNVSQDTLKRIYIPLPTNDLCEKFNSFVDDYHQKIANSLNLINTLQKQRDALLPLLINGHISFKSTELNCDLSLHS